MNVDMAKYELKEKFAIHYDDEYLTYLEERIPGITERLWVAFVKGYLDGSESK